MGRHRREYPKGKLRLKDYKKSDKADKEYTLCYEYTWLDSAPIRKSTGIKVKASEWNKNAFSGRGGLNAHFRGNYQQRNRVLQDALDKYDLELQIYAQKHPNQMTSEIISSILNDAPLTRKDEGKDFVEYTKSFLESQKIRKKIGKSRYENGLSCMKMFSEFLAVKELGTTEDKKSIYLGDISLGLIDEYIKYRRDIKKNIDATINHSLTPIIKACERAANEGLIDRALYAQIKDCRVVETPSKDDDSYDGKSALTKEELCKLIDFYNQDKEPRRKEYIEMFLFAFHAGGMRPVDVMTLTWNNVNLDKGELKKILIKTQKGRLPRHTIPLNDAAISILQKWQHKRPSSKYVFDLIPDTTSIDDEEKLYYLRNSVERKVNQSLNVVGERIGLNFTLTFKTARHTFAILALQDSMSISLVSRMLGHSNTDTTESYYSEYLPKTMKEEVDRLGYNFVPDLKTE